MPGRQQAHTSGPHLPVQLARGQQWLAADRVVHNGAVARHFRRQDLAGRQRVRGEGGG